MVVRTWFLIQEKSGVANFSKNENLKKGGQRGCNQLCLSLHNDYMKKCKFDLGNSHQSLVSWYKWSEPTFRNDAPPFAPPFYAPPFAPPFVFRPPEQKSWIFPIFEAGILCSWASRDFCPPFLPPLLVYLESSRSPLQFMYVSFFLKMLCFGCTDPCCKNELVLLLWIGRTGEIWACWEYR